MKKKSHRKDVIIARIIFALLCLGLLVGIAAAVVQIRDHFAQKRPETVNTQNGNGASSEYTNPFLPPVTENPDTESAAVDTENDAAQTLWTSTKVNFRENPTTDAKVLTVLAQGAELTLLGEEDGWIKVSYNGQAGYVKADFVTDTKPAGENQ